MTPATDLKALRRASARAGLISLLGALIVFAGLGYSSWRLLGLQAKVTAIQAEIAELTPIRDQLSAANAALDRDNHELSEARDALASEKEALEETRTKLQVEIESLRAERDRLREGFQQVKAIVAAPGLQRQLEEAVPLSAVATPRASSARIDARLSRYAVWIEVPSELRGRIARVSYLFNHDSFRDKHPSSTDASADFRVEYTGWGCLDSVVATVVLKDGDRQKIVFDMCALIARAGAEARPEPTKVERAKAGVDAPLPTFEEPAEVPHVEQLDRPIDVPGLVDKRRLVDPDPVTPGEAQKRATRPTKREP
ncbi:MAG: hypothetical protein H6710_08450 [Myxococcales bacterium]|nr:hypothetical protein [Myxococcales bacterium]MCB9704276.1 hypothetical protein [Myxococcales bacterium]